MRKGNNLQGVKDVYLPESGLDCFVCAEFVGQLDMMEVSGMPLEVLLGAQYLDNVRNEVCSGTLDPGRESRLNHLGQKQQTHSGLRLSVYVPEQFRGGGTGVPRS